MTDEYKDFFYAATGKEFKPYPYQLVLSSHDWPDALGAPTGLGKTAAVTISWLFKRHTKITNTPRRLVYCLPMRVLVEQTAQSIQVWIDNLVASGILSSKTKPQIYVLMGGDLDNDWDRYPERDAIIIGTQDQLLSRALNRGYGLSRFRWPMAFGLLNNDCLWVMDEVQIMGVGLSTTTQLQAFRDKLGTMAPVRSIWMSATFNKEWLKTVDFTQKVEQIKLIELSGEDRKDVSVRKKLDASKPITRASCLAERPDEVAKLIADNHCKGTRTLVVVNTVKRAKAIYNALNKNSVFETPTVLLHSCFRPDDRQISLSKLFSPLSKKGIICISTQVIEAGVDISVTTLITDLAPWASLVQRFGRCNRYGTDSNAKIIWLHIDTDTMRAALPYEAIELQHSAGILSELSDACPANLPKVSVMAECDHVLRSKDIVELFDTTPDLAGMDIDISKYIRESSRHDVTVFWRDIPKDTSPDADEPSPSREELCNVSMGDVKALTEKSDVVLWHWDHIEKQWVRPVSIVPGMVLMMRIVDGCYNSEIGWSGNRKDIPKLNPPGSSTSEGNDDDNDVLIGWQSLPEHTDMVVDEVKKIAAACNITEEKWTIPLRDAGRLHDVGKAHDVCLNSFSSDSPGNDPSIIWAKTNQKGVRYSRKGFRHELASAIAMLQNGFSDLSAYLAAAHHGKVRLSIRSIPGEKKPSNPDIRFARGVWEGDILKETFLGDGYTLPETALDLSYMEFGEGPRGLSWLARMIQLRDDESIGPFRLAYLESILRAADWRASEKTGN